MYGHQRSRVTPWPSVTVTWNEFTPKTDGTVVAKLPAPSIATAAPFTVTPWTPLPSTGRPETWVAAQVLPTPSMTIICAAHSMVGAPSLTLTSTSVSSGAPVTVPAAMLADST